MIVLCVQGAETEGEDMITLEKLNELGCDTGEGLKRCLNDEGFYLKLVPGAFEKTRYEELEKKTLEGDLEAAFDDAHALKGVLSNLAITPLNDVVSEITEHLRAKENMDYSALFSKMWDIYHKFEELL